MKKQEITYRLTTFLISIILLTACDLGSFDPVDIFTQEPLEEDAIALETINDCDFTLLVNNDRIQQANTSATIKGSVYALINSNEIYLASGEFDVSTDVEGRVTTLTGFANTQLFKTDYLDETVSDTSFFANFSLHTDELPFVFADTILPTEGCYLFYQTSEDSVQINSGDGLLGLQQAYVNPTSQFMLYQGSMQLTALSSRTNWFAIDPSASFSFSAENSTETFEFEDFDAQVYTEGSLPLMVDSIAINPTGNHFIDASYENGGMQNFFNGNNGNIQIGSNGTLQVSYVLGDRLLTGFEFYVNADREEREAAFNVSPATSAIQAEQSLTLQEAIVLNLADKGVYGLRDAELKIDPTAITLSGIFVSPFATLPDIFVSGNLNANGDMVLSGQSIFAVNFEGTILPVTFSVNVEVTEDEEILEISGLAEYCEGNNCNFLPVNTAADFQNEVLQLCVDLPNQGQVCIQ